MPTYRYFSKLPPEIQAQAQALADYNSARQEADTPVPPEDCLLWPQAESKLILNPFLDCDDYALSVDPVQRYGLAFLESKFCQGLSFDPLDLLVARLADQLGPEAPSCLAVSALIDQIVHDNTGELEHLWHRAVRQVRQEFHEAMNLDG